MERVGVPETVTISLNGRETETTEPLQTGAGVTAGLTSRSEGPAGTAWRRATTDLAFQSSLSLPEAVKRMPSEEIWEGTTSHPSAARQFVLKRCMTRLP
ncbi:MAG: hypothetical protein IJI36_10255 [Kiritimatiellae bacterium]|nr:hypothetical protein [Kiritimatiellia bacterium]